MDAESFAGNAAANMRWLNAAVPHAPLRLAHVGGEIVGGYMLLPAGQFFGGRSVPAQGVTAVAVHPAWRRRGVAGALMRDCIAPRSRARGRGRAPACGNGPPLSPLGLGGVLADAPADRPDRCTDWAFRALEASGPDPTAPLLKRCAAAHLVQWDGPLDRPDWFLSVEWDPGDGQTPRFEYGWYEGDALTGYVRYESERQPGSWIRLRVQEFIATTLDATRGLLGFLGGQESQSSDVVFVHSALVDVSPLLWLLPEPHRNLEVAGLPLLDAAHRQRRGRDDRAGLAGSSRGSRGAGGDRPGHRRRTHGGRGRGRVGAGHRGRERCDSVRHRCALSVVLKLRCAPRTPSGSACSRADADAVAEMDGLVAGGLSLDARLLLIARS